MEDCIFCKIARGEIPVDRLYEDESVVAFPDMHPQAPVHVLIIPKAHYSGMNDDIPANVHAALCAAVTKVAQATGVAEGGYRLIVNTGPDAGQMVHHLHLHLLGGGRMSEGMVRMG